MTNEKLLDEVEEWLKNHGVLHNVQYIRCRHHSGDDGSVGP